MFRRIRLGDVLLKAGLVSEPTLAEALDLQKKEGGKLGELLVRENLISLQQLQHQQAFSRLQQVARRQRAVGHISNTSPGL